MNGRFVRWLTILAAVALLSGCGYLRRVSQCRQLVGHVNTALTEIGRVQAEGPARAETYRDVADRYEKLSKELEGIAGGTDALGRTVKEYATLFQETANTTRTLALLMEKNEAAGVARIGRELGNLGRREKTLVARIDATCHGPS